MNAGSTGLRGSYKSDSCSSGLPSSLGPERQTSDTTTGNFKLCLAFLHHPFYPLVCTKHQTPDILTWHSPLPRIDSIYLPWYQDLRAALLSDFPLPDSVTPIPDDIQLPPKYLVKLSSPIMALPALSARRSHVDRAPSAEERIQEDIERKSPKFPGWFARENEAWETINKRSVDTLDKDNILKDYPEKYLLEKSDDVSEPVKPFVDELKVPGGYTAYLSDYTRVTPKDHWQDVRLLRFEFYGELERLKAIQDWGGQLNLTIYPKNSQDDVEELISMMGWQSVADTPLEIPVMPKRLHLAGGEDATTIRTLLFHSLDFTAIPKRNFIRELAHFTDIELEKERLRELTDSVNIQEYYDYACRPRRTILELLRDFPGVKIPHERILDLFQPIRGREFSVASGGASLRGKTAQSDDDDDVVDCCLRMEILVAMVEYKTIIRKPRQGLCSRYIKTLKPGSFLTVSVESSSLPRLVSQLWSRRPMIAVATGTGIAPIRALVQERSNWPSPGDTLIFYGCRNRAADYYFENEWKQHSNVAIFPAFSRDKDQISPKPAATTVKANDWLTARIPDQTFKVDKPQYDDNKNYVQHLIRQKAETVLHFLKQGPIVCVCGNAGRMPVSVRNAFLDVLVSTGHCENKEAAARWFDNPKNLTFLQECW